MKDVWDWSITISTLLEKDCSVSIHTRNLQFLVTEVYKLAKGISPTIMQEISGFEIVVDII